MRRTLLAVLHLIGAVIFVVFMVARTAQAVEGAPGACPAPPAGPASSSGPCLSLNVTNTPIREGRAAPSTGSFLFQ